MAKSKSAHDDDDDLPTANDVPAAPSTTAAPPASAPVTPIVPSWRIETQGEPAKVAAHIGDKHLPDGVTKALKAAVEQFDPKKAVTIVASGELHADQTGHFGVQVRTV